MFDLFLMREELKNKYSDFDIQVEKVIHDIYCFLRKPSPETACMTEDWKKEFVYMYGDVISGSFGEDESDIQLLFFASQTFLSIILKIMALDILDVNYDKSTDAKGLLNGESALLKGIENYCDEDYYCWPIYELDNGFNLILDKIISLLLPYKIRQSVLPEINCTDIIMQIYETIIPKKIRHALGEFYTPEWLAERTFLLSLKYIQKSMDKLRIADPTCGSGIFITQAIMAKRKANCSLENILHSVYGFDINPLAVLAARTNYLMAIADMLSEGTTIKIPIYRIDILQLAKKGNIVNNENINVAKSLGKADLIIGNPPWVNWEYMPENYRRTSQHLWTDYGLFCAKGRELSFSKEDISVLITYVVMDKLLNSGGIIGFVIRQGVFKSAQNGVGFRRFRIGNECNIKVLRVDDLSQIRVFKNAVVNTALFFARKGESTIYPIPYFVWDKEMGIQEQCAFPSVEDDDTSPWITVKRESLEKIKRVLGSNPYRARTGVFTGGANGVYWLNIRKKAGNNILACNVVSRAKRKVEKVEAEFETDYVFPMVKGSDVQRWHVSYDTYILCPHTSESRMWPTPAAELAETCPKTYEYLTNFRRELDNRKGFAGWEKQIQDKEFHAVLRVGDYTFSKYKVVWKYIAKEFICAVVKEVDDIYLGRKICLPNEKIMYVGTDDEAEAYYLCGVLSSSLVAECVKSYMNPTSISAHVLDKLNIPKFDSDNKIHMDIADACKKGHESLDVDTYLGIIDKIVNDIY